MCMYGRTGVTASSAIEGCSTGGYTGWVTRVGIPGGWVEGLYRYPATLLGEQTSDSGAGPGSPCRGLEWVV